MIAYSPKFIVGIVLIGSNVLVGWGGAILCAFWAKKTKKKIYYVAGTAVYCLSWGMLILGAALAGPEGVALMRRQMARYGIWAVPVIVVAAAGLWYLFGRPKRLRCIP